MAFALPNSAPGADVPAGDTDRDESYATTASFHLYASTLTSPSSFNVAALASTSALVGFESPVKEQEPVKTSDSAPSASSSRPISYISRALSIARNASLLHTLGCDNVISTELMPGRNSSNCAGS